MSYISYDRWIKLSQTPISELRGIGVKRAEALRRLGIFNFLDLIEHFPRAYQNRGNVRLLSSVGEGENCSFLLTVGTQPRSVMLKNRKLLTKFTAFDESGTVTISFFNSKFVEGQFHVGELHRFWGAVKKVGSRYTMASPQHEMTYEGDSSLPDFIPVYPSGAGLTQGIIQEAIASALQSFEACEMPEALPKQIREKLKLKDRLTSYKMIHSPSSMSDIEQARLYFTASQTYIFALALSSVKGRKKSGTPPKMQSIALDDFIGLLGFELTNAQKRSILEIEHDMVSGEAPMARLLSGDVGSGKTAVAAAAALISLKNGYQTALMAPTEILASQHYDSLHGIMSSLGFKAELLLGSMTMAEKKRIRSRIAAGDIDLIIGTHALITPDTQFNRLGLVITDEQHRFGVNQRASLGRSKETQNAPHVLVMSATPIPRTLALILYGELSLSMLDELPAGRQRVDTFVVDESYRERLLGFIRKQISLGGQVYIVCPAIEKKEDENDDLISFDFDSRGEMNIGRAPLHYAEEYCEQLKNQIFPDLRVGLVHGKMKPSEKDSIMRRFSSGEVDILVSTTVIEVGVNVPNASLMIVENAERFGLSQLHQLRGRVGRGKRKSYCVLVKAGRGEAAERRLGVMKSTYDGYKIAEYDLKLRGPGDYFPSKSGGARQHGSFGCISCADMPMLKDMICEAEGVLREDPALSLPENRPAAEAIRELFSADERAMQ